MGIEVLLVQHGEKVRSPGDPGLTATGRQQAAAVAAWLSTNRSDIESIWASPLRRARETAGPIAAALELDVQTDARLRERMNWDDKATISLDRFLVEWQRASADRSYHPAIGDSRSDAAGRFLAALADIEEHERGGLSSLSPTAASRWTRSAPSSAMRRSGPPTPASSRGASVAAPSRSSAWMTVSLPVTGYPSTTHLHDTTEHRPA